MMFVRKKRRMKRIYFCLTHLIYRMKSYCNGACCRWSLMLLSISTWATWPNSLIPFINIPYTNRHLCLDTETTMIFICACVFSLEDVGPWWPSEDNHIVEMFPEQRIRITNCFKKASFQHARSFLLFWKDKAQVNVRNGKSSSTTFSRSASINISTFQLLILLFNIDASV